MKLRFVIAPIALLGLVGCTGQETPVASTPDQPEAVAAAPTETVADDETETVSAAPADDADAGVATLVSLKVPNMH